MAEVRSRNMCVSTIHNIHSSIMSDPEPEQDWEQLQVKRNYLLSVFERFSEDTEFLLEITLDDEQRASHSKIYEETKQVFREANNWYAQQIQNINLIDTEITEHEQDESNNFNRNSENNEYREIQREQNQPSVVQSNPTLPPIIVQLADNGKMENTWGEFNGELIHWHGFHDRFKTAVHDKPNISNAFKLQYLQSSLKGKAAIEFGDWPSTDGNYVEGWEWMKQRYHRPYQTSKELLWKFYNLPKLERAAGGMIQKLSNVTNEVIRQLRALDYPVEHFDLIFVHGLHDRLDPETSKAWELNRKSENPTVFDMLNFLDRQAKALTGAQFVERKSNFDNRKRFSNEREHHHEKKKFRMEKEPAKEDNNKTIPKFEPIECKLCKGEQHPLIRCLKFKTMNLAARKKFVREHQLCNNCLRPAHFSKDCHANACFRCNIKHNSLICPENPKNKIVATVQFAKDGQAWKEKKRNEPTKKKA